MSFVLSKKSIDILSNLASIEPSMILVEGNKQSTSSVTTKIYATAKLPDEFDASFGMYNIIDLLSKFRLFKDEFNLEYNEDTKTVVVFDNHSSVTVHTSDVNMIAIPKIDISIGEDESDILINLSNEDLSKMVEFSKVTGTNIISFTKRDNDKYIRLEGYIEDKIRESNKKGYLVDPVWFMRIGEEVDIESFSYYAKMNFKILEDDYTVRIRQYHGVRGEKSNPKTARMPAIQMDGEYMRYVILYQDYSVNQKMLQSLGD